MTSGAGSVVLPVGRARPRSRGMSMLEAFRLAFQALLSNKMRSILTMLGVIIGVASFIVTVALGTGAAEQTQEAIRKMGTNVMSVVPASMMRGGVSQGLGTQQNLTMDDVEAIKRLSPSVKHVVPEYRGNGQVKFQNQNTRTSVYGTTPPYFEIRNMPIQEGKYFTDDDVKRLAKVAVLGDSVRETLFGSLQPIGKHIKLNGQNFRVIGTIKKRGGLGFRNPDDQITIPVTTAMRRVFGVDYLNSMSVQAVSENKMLDAQEEVEQAVRRSHKQRPEEPSDVRVFNQAEISETAAAQSAILTATLGALAIISLIVGGIGIMNIMLVSVTERTREIGIRKAIGAKRKHILYQFLIESVSLSILGGTLGIILGVGLTLWMKRPVSDGGWGLPMLLSAPPMIISFTSSAVVGVIFGIYPAWKASALNPIDALRYE